MLKDLRALRNFIAKNMEIGNTVTREHIDFLHAKLTNIADQVAELEKKRFEAETKEKLGIERQKEFGKSQTQVEDSRHEHILEEIKALKEAGVVAFNRSSYPFLPRHKKPHHKEKKPDKDNNDERSK